MNRRTFLRALATIPLAAKLPNIGAPLIQATIDHKYVSSGFGITWIEDSDVPVGTIYAFMGTVPYGWLPCDGRTVDKKEYAGLFNILGDVYGDGKIPDLRSKWQK